MELTKKIIASRAKIGKYYIKILTKNPLKMN